MMVEVFVVIVVVMVMIVVLLLLVLAVATVAVMARKQHCKTFMKLNCRLIARVASYYQ